MDRLRVLRVATRLNVGGPALHVSLLTAHLDPARFESLLAIGRPGREEGDMLELRPELRRSLDDRLVVIPGLGRSPRATGDARAARHLWKLIGRFRPHIVHTHMAKAGTLGRLAAVVSRVPIRVHTFHGTVFRGHFRAPWGGAIAAWERLLGRASGCILAVSPAVAAELEARRIAPGKVRVIPLGLELSRFAEVPEIEAVPPPVVTLVARLAPVKDVALFLQAVEEVRARMPDVEARVVGDGPMRASLEETAPWVRFLGNRADVDKLMAETGVVALSSRSEGSPVSLIEALAAARPVAGVPVGGVVDLLEGRPGAVIATDRSADALARAIEHALNDRTVARGAAAGRERVLGEFSFERLVGDIEALYEELWVRHHRRSHQGPRDG